MERKNGLRKCEEALDRLLANRPHHSEFVGTRPEDITPAMVSTEAGFDKGYLKKNRESHKPIMARIGSFKGTSNESLSSDKLKLERAIKTAERRKIKVEELQRVVDNVLTHNLMLLERVRELEIQARKYDIREHRP